MYETSIPLLKRIEQYLLTELNGPDHVFCNDSCEARKLLLEVQKYLETLAILR